jgi:hypothetical protein
MSQNPINLAVRFLLELVGLYAFGLWGWTQHAGFLRYLLVIGLPVVAAALWGHRSFVIHDPDQIPIHIYCELK